MGHYAKVVSGKVTQVIVAKADFFQTFVDTTPGEWVKTSYNTYGGVHYGPDGKPDNGVALRKNYAGIGYTYDKDRDAFIPPQPYSKWILNEQTCLWEPPIPMPESEDPHYWDDDKGEWIKDTEFLATKTKVEVLP